ncbi:MAG: D-alanyl-D-alanine carboxypeptidase [Clostridiales bacterium]|nr:D-alanyl-D-alanine carboxypeptidase [Clostridiales bacterium]
MRRTKAFSVCICLTAVILAGCGRQTEFTHFYEPAQMRTFLSASVGNAYADTFASDLCVVTGSEPGTDETVTAEAAAVFDVSTGQVICQKDPFERKNPASITKIMTALIAIRDGDPDEVITVGEETVITERGASLCRINPGDTLTLEDLLYGLMLPSGNDAAAAIAVHMSGSIEAFAERMNEEAWAIGATNTHFTNPHGLTDPDHYTTAYDLYLIFYEAMQYPEFRRIISTKAYTAAYTDADGLEKSQEWTNSNWYLTGQATAPEGLTVIGGKTGTTAAAGSCLIMDSQDSEGRDYISVVLKADSRDLLYEDMTNIIQKIVN